MRDKYIKYYIDEMNQGKTIRAFIEGFYVSHKKIYKLDVEKAVLHNGDHVSFDQILNQYDVLEIDETVLKANPVTPNQGDIEIVYEDEDMLILNKPYGCLVYSDGSDYDTLTNRVAYHYDSYYPILPVHRIDFDTSGLVVFAKHPMCQSYLSRLFELNEINKTYVCLVEKILSEKTGIIDAPIAKDRHDNKMRVSKEGKYARTSYEVIAEYKNMSRLRVMISGGRKHQIRVHLRSIGHPIVSDKLYGHVTSDYPRLMLHFETVSFIHPRTHQLLTVTKDAEF